MLRSITDHRADWIGIIEAIHAPTKDATAWTDDLIESTRRVFPTSMLAASYVLDYADDLSGITMSSVRPLAWVEPSKTLDHNARVMGPAAWAPFHFGGAVRTQSEVMGRLSARARAMASDFNDTVGYRDSVAMIAHPYPGRILVVHVMSDDFITLSRRDRELLQRVAFHLEAGARLRDVPGSVRARISARGKLSFETESSLTEARVTRSVDDIERARSKRGRDGDATQLWSALVEGEVCVTPRDRGYVVVENAPRAKAMRALTSTEAAVVEIAIRGASTKAMSYALGISSARISMLLASATHKLGLLSRTELVRLAALLVDIPKSGLSEEALTAAEEDVLALLERGLSNAEIARLRMRSVRTIANQVAALLRKTNSGSRRELAVRSAQRRRASQ